jgi:hypothetical protein
MQKHIIFFLLFIILSNKAIAQSDKTWNVDCQDASRQPFCASNFPTL